MNRKGASISSWFEGIIFSIMIVASLVAIGVSWNSQYGTNYDLSNGLITNNTQNDLSNYIDSIGTATSTDQATFTESQGLTFGGLWGMIKSGYNIIGSFITGSWIEKVSSMAQFPAYVGLLLRLLFIFSLVIILIKLLTKVDP